ncbi:cell division protein FtsQ/DivIB [Defluviimonas sp. WL0024]|uniref:Cell division protein FtsQ n=2 Tax=Albidovulum TaxID=205889 RepID=A0ABT3J5R3_9RHOB|nr:MULTISPECIES: cell division protein FtsQ/DivIB [Defluviimonas]MCU9849631.1 cell division protein FtsQ/DivIB [Defluviimonas sp. WL0024]MCW3783036.1 cell division protein FtsQ/DivIB [Defluviimonas salinarum]
MRPLRAPEVRHGEHGLRRDPAPSRLAFRIERLWLTPMFRVAMRVGVPVALCVVVVGGYLANEGRRAAIGESFAELRRSIEERPEFMVTLMAIDGASEPVAKAIRAMLPVTLPVSSFRLDLAALRATIEQIDAVASAELHVRKGGVLQITVVERQPAVLWRNATGLEMLDATGHRVATLLDRTARPDLPVIAGMGADDRVGEALEILRAARPIGDRIRGLVWMGERRWDIVLDRDQRILLPEEAPVPAVQRVIALDEAEDMFGRALVAVDMRNRNRPTVRLAAMGTETENLTGLETKVTGQ